MRYTWTFDVPAGELLGAARERLAHHEGRIVWWQSERDKAKVLVESSVKIRTWEGSHKDRMTAEFDSAAGGRMTECDNALTRHHAERNHFRAMIFGLERKRADETLPLTEEDIVWFGLVKIDNEEENT